MKTLLLILALSLSITAQTVTELQAKAKAMKAKDVAISYDKFKDRSFLMTKPYNLVGGGEALAIGMADGLARGPYGSGRGSGLSTTLHVSLAYSFKGEKLDGPPALYALLFRSQSADWVFLKGDKNLYILFDDERLELAPVDTDSDIGYKSLSEQLAYAIKPEDLKRIVNAKSVELKLGPKPRKIKPELLKRFEALLELTTSGG